MPSQVYIVYIRSGGDLVAQIITNYLTQHGIQVICSGISCRRQSTKIKTSILIPHIIKTVIQKTPYRILNFFRQIEHFYLNSASHHRQISDCEINWSILNNINYVLVVDDAVDSGHSLAHVVNYINKHSVTQKIHTFAVVVTRKMPVIIPTYSIFHRLLIRFPWSMDFKQ